jgi:hypothetical protein
MESGKHLGIRFGTPRERIDRFENEKAHNHGHLREIAL